MARVALNLETDIQPVSEFRSNAAELLRQVRDEGRPVVITQRGKGAAVLVEIHQYQALIDELELLRDVQRGLADARSGREVPHEDARARLRDRYR